MHIRTRTLLFLQVIMQLQDQLSGDSGSPNVFNKPEHILSFVKHVLEHVNLTAPENPKPQQDERTGNGLSVKDLLFLPTGDQFSNKNTDEETPGSPTSDDEMTETAINLVLSILEGVPSSSNAFSQSLTRKPLAHSNLTEHTTLILHEISSLLLSITKRDSHPARVLAQEARLVITARLASTSMPPQARSKPTAEEPTVIYQKALKLLQDPILPVRAHGLLLLRQLVSRTSPSPNEPAVDAALVPAILSIFLQSIQDNDSYMFLNAVQGLAAMVDTFGRDVLKGLVNQYAQVSDGNLTQHEVDVRLRVGEALGQVIRRCGEALVNYGEVHTVISETSQIDVVD